MKIKERSSDHSLTHSIEHRINFFFVYIVQTLILEDASNKKQLKDIEDNILDMLATAEGSLLDNQELIDALASSKVEITFIHAQ